MSSDPKNFCPEKYWERLALTFWEDRLSPGQIPI
jgi:hypothetical protein